MRLRIRGIVALTAVTLAVMSVGCAMQQKPEESRQDTGQRGTERVRYDERMGGGPANDNRGTRVGQTMRAADDIADSIARMDAIDTAAAVVTDRTAYVGVTFDKDYRGGMTSKVKDMVAKRARRVDPSLNRVYVSANPGFVDSLENYARSAREGRPVSGMIDGFMDLVQRTFPEAR